MFEDNSQKRLLEVVQKLDARDKSKLKALKLGFNKIDSFEANNRSQWLGMLMNEDISIDVEVGDTIMTGRFKNKRTVVKSIGKDEHGMPTINGKKVVTFRKATEKNKK